MISQLLKKEDGSVYIKTIFIMLFFIFIMVTISEYSKTMSIALNVDSVIDRSVIEVATENYDELYRGLRENTTYASKYDENNDIFEQEVDVGEIKRNIVSNLGLNNKLEKRDANNKLMYRVENIDIKIDNSKTEKQNKFYVTVDYDVDIAILNTDATIKVSRRTESSYSRMF